MNKNLSQGPLVESTQNDPTVFMRGKRRSSSKHLTHENPVPHLLPWASRHVLSLAAEWSTDTHSPLAKSFISEVRLVKVRMGIRANGSCSTQRTQIRGVSQNVSYLRSYLKGIVHPKMKILSFKAPIYFKRSLFSFFVWGQKEVRKGRATVYCFRTSQHPRAAGGGCRLM